MLAPDTPQNTAARLRELGDPCTTQKHWPAAKTNHTGHRKMVEDVWPIWFQDAPCLEESGDMKHWLISCKRTFELVLRGGGRYRQFGYVFQLRDRHEKRFRPVVAPFLSTQEMRTQSAKSRLGNRS
jgi:hypothetical protein